MSYALNYILGNESTFESSMPYVAADGTCPNTIQNPYNI